MAIGPNIIIIYLKRGPLWACRTCLCRPLIIRIRIGNVTTLASRLLVYIRYQLSNAIDITNMA